MSNVFDNLINDYLEATGGVEDEIIKALKKLKQEAGDVSDFEAQTLIRQLFASIKEPQEPEKEEETEISTGSQQQTKSYISKADKKLLEKNISAIKKYLDEKTHTYKFTMISDYTGRFIVKTKEDNLTISTAIFICAKPHHCELRAFYPFDGKPDMIYPLSTTMIKRNREHLYGDLQISENGKDIYYRYCFRTVKGINIDDFNLYFFAVNSIAREYYTEIKNICECCFSDSEKDEIIYKLKNLAETIVNTD